MFGTEADFEFYCTSCSETGEIIETAKQLLTDPLTGKQHFLLQKRAVIDFQQLYDRFGHDKTREFWSKISADEQTRRKYMQDKVPFELEHAPVADSVHEQWPTESSGESEDEERTLCEKCCCAKCRKRQRKQIGGAERAATEMGKCSDQGHGQSISERAVRNVVRVLGTASSLDSGAVTQIWGW